MPGQNLPETTNVYFNVSNSTFLNKNLTFIKSKPLFPKVHG